MRRSLPFILLLLFFLTVGIGMAQPADLQQQIRAIAADARGKVSVACALPGTQLNCDLNPKAHPPMQSVFKLPLALTILHEVEQGKFSLDEPIRFLPEDRFVPKAYSPLQDKYPEANVDVPLRTLLQMTVSLSDNAGADILLRIGGGTKAVGEYVASLGVDGFHLEDDEHALHRDMSLQYRNWLEPRAAVQLLRIITARSPLTGEHSRLLMQWMREATPQGRLEGDLPSGTVVAQKTGSSGTKNGMAAATNDIGLITLPDGRQLAIAVFVTDSSADDATRDKVIARIARAAYDAATKSH